MNSKKILISIVFSCVSVFNIFCMTSEEAQALLKQAESKTAFFGTDFSASYEVVQDTPGEGRTKTKATIYRRDSESKWTILIHSPLKDRGKGYLQNGSSLWFYDPADKRFTYTTSKDKFQGTNANTSDFAPQNFVRDYKIESFKEVKLGAYECVQFDLSATTNVDYPKLKLWVTKKDGLMRKKEDYSLSGTILRATAVPSYQTVTENGKKYEIPVNMVIQDCLKGKKINNKVEYEKTLISISNASLKKAEDAVYTKNYLEMMSVQ